MLFNLLLKHLNHHLMTLFNAAWRLLPVLLFLAACASPPEYPNEPQIEFVSWSKNTVNQGSQDTIYLKFSFTDGDGDLGNTKNNATNANIFLTDSRNNAAEFYYLPFIPQNGVGKSISGEVTIAISSICCWNQIPVCAKKLRTEELIYTLQIKDRTGNSSNALTLPPITVDCNHE
jgi:hypothetical protein